MTLFEAEGLTVRIGGRAVVDNVTFGVGRGEFIGLIGPNGAGKSTLLKACLGLTSSMGKILVLKTPLAAMSSLERARAVAYLPQEHEIAWSIAVRHVVELGRYPWQNGGSIGDYAGGEIVSNAMARMEVSALAERPANTLSGGERARVLIARALAQSTPLLLADEPTAGLDPAHQIGLMKLFRSLLHGGRSVVCSMHDLGLAARWCTRLIMIDKGSIIADSTPEVVLSRENLRDIYGVEAFIGEANGGSVVIPTDLSRK